jgi:aspartate beta-hydroxylase
MRKTQTIRSTLSSHMLWSLCQGIAPRNEMERVHAYLMHGLKQPALEKEHGIQRPAFGTFPGLEAKPWHDPKTLNFIEELINFQDVILSELKALFRLNVFSPQLIGDVDLGGGCWDVFYLHVMGQATKTGTALCPQTSAFTGQLSGVHGAGMVFFSALGSGGHIQPHDDGTNTRLRLHLPLVVPEGCTLRVASEKRPWQQGQCLYFDGSFEHEAWNRSLHTRWLLILDLWHPGLTAVERRALARISRWRRREQAVRREAMQQDAGAWRAFRSTSEVSSRG